jgi:hypothetical protein
VAGISIVFGGVTLPFTSLDDRWTGGNDALFLNVLLSLGLGVVLNATKPAFLTLAKLVTVSTSILSTTVSSSLFSLSLSLRIVFICEVSPLVGHGCSILCDVLNCARPRFMVCSLICSGLIGFKYV